MFISNFSNMYYSGALPPLLLWAAAEDGLAIVAASIPTLRPLLKKVFPGSTGMDSDDRKRSYPLKASSNNANMFTPAQGQNFSSATYAPNRKNKSKDFDEESDKSILNRGIDDRNWKSQNIMRTHEVAVTYNDHEV